MGINRLSLQSPESDCPPFASQHLAAAQLNVCSPKEAVERLGCSLEECRMLHKLPEHAGGPRLSPQHYNGNWG